MAGVIKSIYEEQISILKGIQRLYCPDGFECDITYGNGQFWRELSPPSLRFDIDPQTTGVIAASSIALPLADAKLQNCVFDPPFLTYIRAGRKGNGNMVMAKRFAGYWRYDELEAHYRATLRETARVLKRNGILVFKCQDIIHNHRMHCTHANVLTWGSTWFRLKDLFILASSHRMPAPNRTGTQKHARIFHSYFLVLERI
jgi:hypothetical protein